MSFITFIGAEAYISGVVLECSVCGFPGAQSLNGHFSFDGEGMATLIAGPEFTKEAIEQLKNIIQKAKAQKLTPDEVKTEVARVNPKLADFIPKDFADLVGFLTFVIALLTYLSNSNPTIINNTHNNYYHPPQLDTNYYQPAKPAKPDSVRYRTPISKDVREPKSKDSSFLANKKDRKKRKL
ncbi:MAG: hypothetical protein H7122_04020 [Chitinophagaceae bacterium]|nr:hypothetical protein [Chitinophagaceae bacterium]